jgi:hypothetical protein
VLSKKKARLFASEIVQKWKGFELTEQGEKLKKVSDDYLDKTKKFEKAWHKYDQSKIQSGSIDMMDSHKFIYEVIAKSEVNPVQTLVDSD